MAKEIVISHAAPTPVPVTPTAPATPIQPLTEAEKQAAKEDIYTSMWGEKPPAAKPAEVVPPVVEETPAQPEVAPAVAPSAVPATPAAEPTGNEVDIIQRTARATAKETATAVAEILKDQRSAEAPVTAPAPFEMSDGDAEIYRVLLYLQNSDQKYAGKADEWQAYVRKHYAYMDEWVKNNDGKEFNPDDEEHADWYTANHPDIDMATIEDAKLDMKVEERYQKTVAPRMQAIDQQNAFAEAKPKIVDNINVGVLNFVNQVSPELATILKGPDGKPLMTKENISKVQDADPIAFEILLETVQRNIEPILMELEKSVVPNAGYQLNASTNEIHAVIDRYRNNAEKQMVAAPDEVQVVDGKRFITVSDMHRRKSAILSSKSSDAEKRQKLTDLFESTWMLSVDDIAALVIDDYANQAKKKIEAVDGIAKKKYGSKPPVDGNQPPVPAPTPAPAPTPTPEPPRASGKPNPPSLSSGTDVVTTGTPGGGKEKTVGQQVVSVLFG